MIQSIVADGWERAHEASIARVRAEVEAEYAERLAKAGFWERIVWKISLKREIRRRMEKIAPPEALYICSESTDPE